jgi:DNA-binding NarL/FixJ family response regulator
LSRLTKKFDEEAGNMTIRLLIADDNAAMRKNIKSFVNAQPDIEVVGESKDGETAVELAKNLSPDIVLMDISMPKLSGIEAAGNILRNNTAVRIIILSAHSDKSFVVAGLKAGVSGYVLKTSILDDLIPALRAVMANELFLSPKITDFVIGDYTKQPPKADDSVSET